MTGEEFYNAVMKNPCYVKMFEESPHFHEQIQYIREKNKVTYSTLINSIAYLSKELLETEIMMIQTADERSYR